MNRIPALSLSVVAAVLILPVSSLSADTDLLGSMVKVYSRSYPYSYESPWLLAPEESGTGSGCVIAGNRILTAAHVVADAKFIQVKRAGGLDRFQAEVEIVGHQCDLALLRVPDERFFEGAVPLEVGPLVSLRDRVTVYGFPQGGEELSTTEGIVSRVEVRSYAHSKVSLLCGQMDAAINPGSSGGPVVKDGQVVGVAFQAGYGQNISYLVPTPIIRHFLKDVQDGTYDGLPGLAIFCQNMGNPGLRAKYGLGPGRSGNLIVRIAPDSPLKGQALPGDVILSVDGHPVANDGTVEFREKERTDFGFYVNEHFIGDMCDLEVLRDGRVHRLRVKLNGAKGSETLVPPAEHDRQPSYLVVGGLVFQRLTGNYLQALEDGEDLPHLYSLLFFGMPDEGRRAVIVLTGILPDEVNVGYDGFPRKTVIVRANGRSVSTLRELADAVESNTGTYHVFVDEQGGQIVLDRLKTLERGPLILRRYMVPADRSPDLRSGPSPAAASPRGY